MFHVVDDVICVLKVTVLCILLLFGEAGSAFEIYTVGKRNCKSESVSQKGKASMQNPVNLDEYENWWLAFIIISAFLLPYSHCATFIHRVPTRQ